MHAHYGPALLLGALIDGVILLDDVITPEHNGPQPQMAIVHHRQDSIDPLALGADNDRSVWIIKIYDGTTDEIHKDVKIHLETEDDDSSQQEELMVSVRVDADDGPAGDLAAATGAVIDSARAEGRQPTREEIEALISAVAGDARSIDVEVLSSSQQSTNAVGAADEGEISALHIAVEPSQH